MAPKDSENFLQSKDLYTLNRFLDSKNYKTYLEIANHVKKEPGEMFRYLRLLTDLGCLEKGMVSVEVSNSYRKGTAYASGFIVARPLMLMPRIYNYRIRITK